MKLAEVKNFLSTHILRELLERDHADLVDHVRQKVDEWRTGFTAWKDAGRAIGEDRYRGHSYNIKVRQRKNTVAIEWTHTIFLSPNNRLRTVPRGRLLMYQRNSFKFASEEQWRKIQEIERQAGGLRLQLEMMTNIRERLRLTDEAMARGVKDYSD